MGWVAGTLVLIIGLVNIGMAIIPQTFEPFTALTEWINMGSLLIGPTLIGGSVVLIVLAVGLILRLRTAWALTTTALILIGGAEFLYVNTVQVAIAALVLVVILFWKRDAFDRPLVPREDALRLRREFHENVERFRVWRAAHQHTKADSVDDDATQHRRSASSHSEPTASRVRRKTGWDQRAEKGAEISRAAQQEGILSFDDESAYAAAGVGARSEGEYAPAKKESTHDSAR